MCIAKIGIGDIVGAFVVRCDAIKITALMITITLNYRILSYCNMIKSSTQGRIGNEKVICHVIS